MHPSDGDITQRLSAILSRHFEQDVRIESTHRIEPWSVLRARLSPAAEVPATVVVKWLRDGTDDVRRDPDQLRREQVALQFVEQTTPGLAPRLIAADIPPEHPQDGLLIMEDLAPRESLRELILREGAEHAPLDAYARAMARLHATTAGRVADFDTHLRVHGLATLPLDNALRVLPQALAGTEEFGVIMTAAARRELEDALAVLNSPGPFVAMSNGDPQQNNFLTSGAEGRVIDFEAATFRHALMDLALFYIPGSMWLTVNDPQATGLEEAYRTALAPSIPEVGDDAIFGPGIAAAALLETITRLAYLDKLDRRPVGDRSRLHRVTNLEISALTAERHRSLPHLAGWARAVADRLRRLWPDTDIDVDALGEYHTR